MDRRDILAENPVEKRRGYMPGVSVEPDRPIGELWGDDNVT